MADIFVSYAKTDRSLASKLVAMVEAEGWSVWWDTSLAAADLYRDEIMKQLALARAVIAIWTPNSIRSDWVRAEAGTAKNEGKLIPVKTPDVAYADIPLPFGEMHTENLEASELIRAAVVAKLAKPAVEPTAWASLTKGFKYEVLTWWGIIGGAVTLFGAISTSLKLADWARLLVENWKQCTQAFWLWAFGWVGIHLPPQWTPVLSFLLFGSLLTIGQAIQFRRIIKTQPIVDRSQGKSFQLMSWRTVLCVVFTLIVTSWWLSFGLRKFIIFLDATFPRCMYECWYVPMLLKISYPLIIPVVTVTSLVLFAKHRLHAAVAAILMAIFWTIITLDPFLTMAEAMKPDESLIALLTAIAMISFLPLIPLSVAPAKAVSRRLIFLAIGLLLLIGLNELSKLAPKLHEWGL